MAPATGSTNSAVRSRDWMPPWYLLLALIVFAALQTFISTYRFDTLQAKMLDLGNFEQILWKISHGNWYAYIYSLQAPAVSADGSLALYPLAYLFRFLGGPYVLFVVQALGTAVAAWGVYRAGLLHSLSTGLAGLAAILFLLAPGIVGASQFDFHPDFIALPFLVWAYVKYCEGRWGGYYLLAAAAAFSKDVALFGFVGFGLGMILFRKDWRRGAATLVGSLALLEIEVGWLFPKVLHAVSVQADAHLYGYLGKGFAGVLLGALERFPVLLAHLSSHPGYIVLALLPFAGLSLIGGASLPAVVVVTILNLAAAFRSEQSFKAQYQVLLTAWLVLAFLEGITRLPNKSKWIPRVVAVCLAATCGIGVQMWTSVIGPVFQKPLTSVAATRAALSHVHLAPTTLVWTQNQVGAYLYRFDASGVDVTLLPGVMTDPLPRLWSEVPPGATTALVGRTPTSPYFAQILAEAVQAGYRVTFHQANVFVLTGTGHFAATPPAATVRMGFVPASNRWTIPAWTQLVGEGRVDWTNGTVESSRHGGVLVGPVLLALEPGTYRVSVEWTSGPTNQRRVGWLLWTDGPALHRVSMFGKGACVTSAVIVVRTARYAEVTVQSTGHQRFGVQAIDVVRVKS
jgi:uncharacterized membrane protein